MVNREEEMRWLTAALRTSERGAGVLVAVEGPAGSGKTRFVHEARRLARASGTFVMATRALESERTLSGAVTRRLCAPVLWRALGPPPGVSTDGCATADGFVRLVAALAAEGPLLIAGDDGEACDRESLRTLATLALHLDHVGPVTLLLARRTGASHPTDPACLEGIVADPGTVRIGLKPLTRDGVAEMVADALGRSAEPDLVAVVQHLTGGVPALVAEVARAFAGGEPLDGLALPAVAHIVRERAAHAGPGADDLLSALAVLGDDATLAAAAALTGTGHTATAELAQALVG